MPLRKILILFLFISFIGLLFLGCKPKIKTYKTDILIAGGGVSGTAAAIQAARSGARVLIVEETHWLGGMLTAAGVSATDGNHELPSGIWEEFRQKLYEHYGSPEKLATGWVSNTQFEPWVADSILKAMVAQYENITVLYGYHVKKVKKEGKILKNAIFEDDNKKTINTEFSVAIDATELGDFLAKAGADYALGQDARTETGETPAPEKATEYIQDLTYVAILKDFGESQAELVTPPENYDYSEFDGTCKQLSSDSTLKLWDCSKMMTYGKLPNDYYMINWPINGNDTYLNVVEMDYFQRKLEYKKAKETTLAYVYHLQTKGGFSSFGLADKFGTDDKLALIPYHREGRRLKGILQLRLKDILEPYADTSRRFYRQAIACGDYPLDHHHEKNPNSVKEEFPRIPSFSVPYGALVTKSFNNLIVAEKSISVTHVVNGTTRLQPCVMLIGQAAGEAAAISFKNKQKTYEINIRKLQQNLLKNNAMPLPYNDVTPDKNYFEPVHRVALCGWMRGEGVSEGWANRTYFYPDSAVSAKEFFKILSRISDKEIAIDTTTALTKKTASKAIFLLLAEYNKENTNKNQSGKTFPEEWKGKSEEPLNRKELALILDKYLKPFSL